MKESYLTIFLEDGQNFFQSNRKWGRSHLTDKICMWCYKRGVCHILINHPSPGVTTTRNRKRELDFFLIPECKFLKAEQGGDPLSKMQPFRQRICFKNWDFIPAWMRQPALVYKFYHSPALSSGLPRITKAWRTPLNPQSQNCRLGKLLPKMHRSCSLLQM